ncbi:hypothetical protein GCM10009657_16140 [Oryzihumus leptocrescens]
MADQRALGRLFAVLLTVGVLGACGSQHAGQQVGQAPSSPPRATPVPWRRATLVDPHTLKINWGGSPCARFAGASVSEFPKSVSVVITEVSNGAGSNCIAAEALRSTSVTLSAPLGSRTVVGCAPPGPCLEKP